MLELCCHHSLLACPAAGSFSSVFAVLLSDLQKCSPAEATSPTPTPVHSGDFTTAAVANGHGQPAAANGNSCKAASGNGSAAAGSSEQAESDGQIVAVKVLNAKYCTPDDFVRELEVLARCRHETLVVLQVSHGQYTNTRLQDGLQVGSTAGVRSG